ncbi:hypothetical protein PC112_g15917 [Phytophthora cactorum]|nr:hypothetical protein PC112_g15917 [Phytophthora cactorum]
MKEAKIVLPNVESTVKHLRKVSRAIGESKNAAAVHVRLTANSRIAYVKLKKGEVSEHTVVSDCEKYMSCERNALVEFARRRDTNNDYEKERKGGFSVNSV